MIRKITKIILCFFSLLGFTLITVNGVYSFPKNIFFNSLAAAGLGLQVAPAQLSSTVSADVQRISTYNYFELREKHYVPAALSYYDSFPFETDTTGQAGLKEPEDNKADSEPLPEGVFPVIALDMSENQSATDIVCKNESKYSPNINTLLQSSYPLSYSKTVSSADNTQPLVLIVHTHGTECYLPDNTVTYTADTPTRTTDTQLNVVAVGRVLAEELNKKGIPTIHCETMFDQYSYSESYNLSEKAILEYLAAYPSIQYVFDVHRDSIVGANGEKIKPLTSINETDTAQAMFVVGTDSSGADHPNWLDNLTVASYFQSKLIERHGNILRPLNLRAASFNAEHTAGSVLIEIGTCGNTVSEAKNCASLLGQTIGDIILTDGNC